MASISLDEMLAAARAGLARVQPADLDHEVTEGAVLIDIRPVELRAAYGEIEGALVIGMNVLEWRLAPSSAHRLDDVDPDARVILVCQQGYSSSLAAARLQSLGMPRATDLVGGFEALARLREDAEGP